MSMEDFNSYCLSLATPKALHSKGRPVKGGLSKNVQKKSSQNLLNHSQLKGERVRPGLNAENSPQAGTKRSSLERKSKSDNKRLPKKNPTKESNNALPSKKTSNGKHNSEPLQGKKIKADRKLSERKASAFGGKIITRYSPEKGEDGFYRTTFTGELQKKSFREIYSINTFHSNKKEPGNSKVDSLHAKRCSRKYTKKFKEFDPPVVANLSRRNSYLRRLTKEDTNNVYPMSMSVSRKIRLFKETDSGKLKEVTRFRRRFRTHRSSSGRWISESIQTRQVKKPFSRMIDGYQNYFQNYTIYHNAASYEQAVPESLKTNADVHHATELTLMVKELLQRIKKSFPKGSSESTCSKIAKKRKKHLLKYLQNLDSKRKTHPLLSLSQTFELLSETMEIVAKQKTVFFALDCEFNNDLGLPSEIGLSILNPQIQKTSLFPNIISLHIIIKDDYDFNKVESFEDTFLGGRSFMMKRSEALVFLQTILDTLFEPGIEEPSAAFVIHNSIGDLQRLTNMGLKLPKEFVALDTYMLYSASHGFKRETSTLSGLLHRLGIPQTFMHNAGNDAYFTLFALLKLADPQFRLNNNLDDYEEDLKHEHDFRVQAYLLEKKNVIPPQFLERDPRQWNISEFSPPKELEDCKSALKTVYRTRYKSQRL